MRKIVLAVACFLLKGIALACASNVAYPEQRSDLQAYQELSSCYPDVGKWYLMHRNYYSDPNFGGAAKCVTFERYGTYENFSTPARYSYVKNGSTTGQITPASSSCYTSKDQAIFQPYNASAVQETFHVIYVDCSLCFISRHRYANNGYGCSYWRLADTLHQSADWCQFIYDENCGTVPKYQVYDSSCGFNRNSG